jgi:hypothetical protein
MSEIPFEVKSFSGGITDHYVGAAPNMAQDVRNLIVGKDDKAQSRGGLTLVDAVHNQLPYVTTPTRVDSIHKFKKQYFVHQTKNKIYDSTLTNIVGPTGNQAFTSTAVQFNKNSYCEWNNHLIVTNDSSQFPNMLYRSGSSFVLTSMGLPKPVSISVTGSVGTNSYLYALVYKYSYSIDGVTFLVRSAVSSWFTYTGAVISGASTTTVTLPTFTNGTTDNFDTANVKVEIYRTQLAQTVFYKVGEVALGTATYTDNTTDANLIAGVTLYTATDDLNYDRPPKCKFVFSHNGVVYYIGVDGAPNTLIQGNPLQPHAAPAGNVAEFDDVITGVGVASQSVVIFCKDRVYRLDGIYDSIGNGGIFKTEISKNVGTLSHKSVIQTNEGLFFATATDGFYFTDGYKVLRISENIPTRYQSIVGNEIIASRIYGSYDAAEKRLYWACHSSVSSTDNDMIYVCNAFAGVSPVMPFFILDGGNWPSNFAPTAIYFDIDKLMHGDSRGYLFYQDHTILNDLKIDATKSPTLWSNLPIIFNYISPAYDFGDVTRRKWVTKLIVYCDGIAKVSIQPSSNNDNIGAWNNLAEIKSNSPILWGDTGITWGDEVLRWNYSPIISGKRYFPKNSIRCSYKQISLTNAYTNIASQLDFGTVNVDGTLKQITFTDTTQNWLQDPVDYYISFPDDAYVQEFKVTARTSNTVLTVEDIGGLLTTKASTAWKLKGYRKDESLRLLSYTIIYTPLTPSQTAYKGAT